MVPSGFMVASPIGGPLPMPFFRGPEPASFPDNLEGDLLVDVALERDLWEFTAGKFPGGLLNVSLFAGEVEIHLGLPFCMHNDCSGTDVELWSFGIVSNFEFRASDFLL
jgi:hypothetical protein